MSDPALLRLHALEQKILAILECITQNMNTLSRTPREEVRVDLERVDEEDEAARQEQWQSLLQMCVDIKAGLESVLPSGVTSSPFSGASTSPTTGGRPPYTLSSAAHEKELALITATMSVLQNAIFL